MGMSAFESGFRQDSLNILLPIIAPILTIKLVSSFSPVSPTQWNEERQHIHLSKADGPPMPAPTGTGILKRPAVDKRKKLTDPRVYDAGVEEL